MTQYMHKTNNFQDGNGQITIDEFRRVDGGEPKVGKKMKVTFQRHPHDKSGKYSQIQSIHVLA